MSLTNLTRLYWNNKTGLLLRTSCNHTSPSCYFRVAYRRALITGMHQRLPSNGTVNMSDLRYETGNCPSAGLKIKQKTNRQNPWILVRKRTLPTEWLSLVSEVRPNFCGYRSVAWSVLMISTAVNLGFLDRCRYFSIQVAPQLSSRGWVDPVPDPLLLRKCGSVRNRTWDIWVSKQNSDHFTTETVPSRPKEMKIEQVDKYRFPVSIL
jgi:hypothetical protein